MINFVGESPDYPHFCILELLLSLNSVIYSWHLSVLILESHLEGNIICDECGKSLTEIAIVLTPIIVYSYQKTFTIENVLLEVFQYSFIRK